MSVECCARPEEGPWTNPLLRATALVEERIAALKERVRDFFYAVVLVQKPCPVCHEAKLMMIRDGLAEWRTCGKSCDPTVVFQTCGACDSRLVRKTYHYWCPRGRVPVRSHYCLEARVFDVVYFREKTRESRERKKQRDQQLAATLLGSRSGQFVPDEEPTLTSVPGLESDLTALIGITLAGFDQETSGPHFDLQAYRRHLLDLADGAVVGFDGISPLIDDAHRDRVFRFIEAIFLAHEGKLDLEQDAVRGLLLIG